MLLPVSLGACRAWLRSISSMAAFFPGAKPLPLSRMAISMPWGTFWAEMVTSPR